MRKAVGALCLSILALSIPLAVRAQAVYGSIVGTVLDSSGAGVPNAKVTITDLNRSVSFTATTNDSGFFTQRSLIGGRYQVRDRSDRVQRLCSGGERFGRSGDDRGHQAASRSTERDGRGDWGLHS